MENEIIETVLTEILEELKQLKTLTTNNTKATLDNANRLMIITDKLESKQVLKPDINTRSIEQIILSGLEKINSTINQKPAPVKREFRILLFPEYNTKEYYRTVFGRIIFWLVVLVIAKYLYLLGSAWIAGH